jgi:predicted adenine nucleotide alpha hydrolase (AANH) superfamily ATPase
MTVQSPDQDQDISLKTLEENGQRLGIICAHCSRFRYLKSARYAASLTLAALSASLTCSRCGSEDVKAIAVSRDPDNGFWPAEHS